MIETDLKPHDIVALAPIIEGAGGVVTTWDGENAANGGRIIAAGDRAVYDAGAPAAAPGIGHPEGQDRAAGGDERAGGRSATAANATKARVRFK